MNASAGPLQPSGKAVAFRARYGPWALVAGASEGLGEAFARALAQRGLNLVLVARRQTVLDTVGARIESQHGVSVLPLAFDLADAETVPKLLAAVADREVGLLVYNAASSLMGSFFEQPLSAQLALLEVNCRAPLALVHELGRAMRVRRRGGIVLMSSLAGFQGSPGLSSYAATKAFTRVLGEGLWRELQPDGVDVVACHAGATRTPGYLLTDPGTGSAMEPADVVEHALRALGHGPSVVPGWTNRLAVFLMQRLLPRRTAVGIMARALRARYGSRAG